MVPLKQPAVPMRGRQSTQNWPRASGWHYPSTTPGFPASASSKVCGTCTLYRAWKFFECTQDLGRVQRGTSPAPPTLSKDQAGLRASHNVATQLIKYWTTFSQALPMALSWLWTTPGSSEERINDSTWPTEASRKLSVHCLVFHILASAPGHR